MPPQSRVSPQGKPRDFSRLFAVFAAGGTLDSAEHFGSGHIHETFRVRTREKGSPGYILQRVNDRVFPDVARLMENIACVTGHIRGKLEALPGADPDREVLTVVPTRDGRLFQREADGSCWRCFLFIGHQPPGDRPTDGRQAFEAGRLFGRFITQLSDLPAALLHETIPGFHDIAFRLGEFDESLRADPLKRRPEAAAEIAFVRERAVEMKRVHVAGAEGRIRLRITHNDAKFNNVLFDPHGRALCLIDLDTVMPGYIQYDFGDAVRSAANTGREDDPDCGRVGVDLDVFRELARGFLASLSGSLDAEEIRHLAFAAKLFAYMIGLRFLSDYLAGDKYFKTERPGHNLQRARAQFRLLQDMERRFGEMEDIISALAEGSTS